MRNNQGHANPRGTTDVENAFNAPVAVAKEVSEELHADPGIDVGDKMSILTFLKIVSALDGV